MLVLNSVESKFLVPDLPMQQLDDFLATRKLLIDLLNAYFTQDNVPKDVWWDTLRPAIMDSDGMI